MKKEFSFDVFETDGHIKNPLRYYRQANELSLFSLEKLETKGISDEEYFLNSLNYEIGETLKIFYFYFVNNEEDNPSIILIARRLLELYAILKLYNEKLFLPINFRLFKLQALKKIGKNEKEKISKQLNIKIATLENMLLDFTPIYLFGVVDDYSRFRNIILKALDNEGADYYDTLGILIHQSSLKSLELNPKFKDGIYSLAFDLSKEFYYLLSPFKKFPHYKENNDQKYLLVKKRVDDFNYSLINLYYSDIIFTFKDTRLIDEIFTFISSSLFIFTSFLSEGYYKYIIDYFKVMFEKIALYDYLITNYKEDEVITNFNTYSLFSYLSLAYAYTSKNDKIYEQFYHLKDEFLEGYKNKYKKSKNYLYTKMISSPQYAIFLKDISFKDSVINLLIKYLNNDKEKINHYLSIYNEGVNLSHASIFLAFIEIKNSKEKIKEGFSIFSEFVINILNYFNDDESYFVNHSLLKGSLKENDELTKLRLKIIYLRNEYLELVKLINDYINS